MAFTLHALRPGDVFADIGANVGTYTILAAGVAGASCVSIEPAADSFEKLLFNVGLNRLQNDVRLLNVAVGAQDGEVYLTSGRGPTNHIVNERTVDRKAVVPQRTFDSLTDTERPLVTKVDIEGYELEFLKGAHRALSGNDPSALIVELSGHGTRYAASDFETATYILRFGFEVAVYDPFTRVLTPGGLATESGNVLFIRDLPFFQCRVASAEPVTVLRHRI
jgi:FkbM family methyltransferase